jgi:hypothetical protein
MGWDKDGDGEGMRMGMKMRTGIGREPGWRTRSVTITGRGNKLLEPYPTYTYPVSAMTRLPDIQGIHSQGPQMAPIILFLYFYHYNFARNDQKNNLSFLIFTQL